MDMKAPPRVDAAEIVLPCADIGEALDFYREALGFKLMEIFPADAPAVAVIEGYGLRVRLDRNQTGEAGRLILRTPDPQSVAGGKTDLAAPNGTRIEIVDSDPPLEIPPEAQSLVITRIAETGAFHTGRAGMQYRDLIPDRQGGRFIASHIRIPGGGPVPDNVHFHKIRFQMIFCYKGWVRLVYEDQGEPFIMKAGDCVMQPPEIRHRVLESGDDLEVIEIGCPAEHMTLLDHRMDLPTGKDLPDRDYGGQRFVFHEADKTPWQDWRFDGFEARDIGIGAATDGLAGARVVRPKGAAETPRWRHDGEFLFQFVLTGGVTLAAEGNDHPLEAGDCITVPKGLDHALTAASDDLEILEVTLPAALPVTG